MKKKKTYTRIEKLKIAGRVALALLSFFGPWWWCVHRYDEFFLGFLLGIGGVSLLALIAIAYVYWVLFRTDPKFREATQRRWREEAADRRIRRSRLFYILLGGGNNRDMLGGD